MDQLLQVKLTVPRSSQRVIRRPRLIGLLDGTRDSRLLLLSAPPGFGKTSALADWLAASGMRCAWLGLDEADNDPVRFLRYLWAAVSNIGSDDPLSLPAKPPAGDLSTLVEEVAAILSGRREPSLLVLDDYHLIESAEVQRAVTLLLDQLPSQAHLGIATRVDPALPLARLRARGELLEVRADALRFTSEEARAFFTGRMGLDSSCLGSRRSAWRSCRTRSSRWAWHGWRCATSRRAP